MQLALLKLVLAILGIALYTAFKSRSYMLAKGQFDWSHLLQDNVSNWVWSLVLLILITVIISIEPEASTAIKSFTGLDLQNTTLGFLTLGVGLAGFTRNTTK